MSYFDDASLVFIPSGTKVSKAYSVKPIDGTGDLTFSRSNDTATRVGPDGLIEKVRTNLITYSEDLSNAAYTNDPTSGSVTITANYGVAPDGTNTADRVQITRGVSYSQIYQAKSVTAGIEYSFSLYLKSLSGTPTITILYNEGGAVGKVTLTSSWVRYTFTYNAPSTSTNYPMIALYAGDSASCDILAWGLQFETGVPTDYIATTSAAVSVGPVANVPRLDYLGSSCPRLLLEPQRTNNAQFSEQFDNAYWSKSNATVTSTLGGPIDQSKYFTITCNATTGAFKGIKKDWINAAPNTYTLSVFAKSGTSSTFVVSSRATLTSNDTRAIFNLANGTITNVNGGTATIVPYADGWYRCSFTVVNSGTYSDQASMFFGHPHGAADGATVLATGAMSEIGAYPTSYVNTLGASVTRGADAASKTGVSSLIGQTEGTLFAEGSAISTGSGTALGDSGYLFAISDNTLDNQITIRLYPFDGNYYLQVRSGGVFVVGTSYTPTSVGQNVKIAIAYKANDFAFYVNGTQIATASSGAVPALSAVNFGQFVGPLDAIVNQKQALLFKTRLTNAQLAELTTL